ncbi:MAG TPA: hypothetical protein VHF87_05210 [Methylomirabilota bacterium]|jgi:hypothetical protein|nr:hypothetical protein [Methylomirabilota bacterium]
MPRRLALVTVAVLGIVFAGHVWGQPRWRQPARKVVQGSQGFSGYWMGVDPLDGGDSRRSLVRLEDGRFALAGRDSALTLCDGTDRGFISFDDGLVVGGNVLRTDGLTIECFNTGASVELSVRYELIGNGVLVEDTTRPDGTPVSRIVFHRVSRN